MKNEEKRHLQTLPITSTFFNYSGQSNPFSVGERILKYSSESILKEGAETKSSRTDFFEKKLLAVSTVIGGPVPYAFRTLDGDLRSLDAGCLGHLTNKPEPELALHRDDAGFVVAVVPLKPLVSRYAAVIDRLTAGMEPALPGRDQNVPLPAEPASASQAGSASRTYSLEELRTDALKPAMELLIAAAKDGGVVTYGELADHLRQKLNKPTLSHRHMGHVAGPLMDRLLQVDPAAPLINLMVVRGDSAAPGEGADPYLKRRFGLARIPSARRPELVRAGLNEVWSYTGWDALFERTFGESPQPVKTAPEADFDDDGQGDNPKYGGRPESDEHKALKTYVAENPKALKLGLSNPITSVEKRLLSGDEMDVEIVDGSRRYGVEVKSIKSGWADLRRGIYQCVKYRAVLIAQSGFSAEEAQCDAVLVTEFPLPNDLKTLAKRLEVVQRIIRVNPHNSFRGQS